MARCADERRLVGRRHSRADDRPVARARAGGQDERVASSFCRHDADARRVSAAARRRRKSTASTSRRRCSAANQPELSDRFLYWEFDKDGLQKQAARWRNWKAVKARIRSRWSCSTCRTTLAKSTTWPLHIRISWRSSTSTFVRPARTRPIGRSLRSRRARTRRKTFQLLYRNYQ